MNGINGINVTKRDGSIQPFNLDKVHQVLEWATEDITGVSMSEIELKANIQLFDKIPAYDIHELLIKSAAELISENTPNYQFVAARLISYKLRKEAYAQYNPPHLLEIIKNNVDLEVNIWYKIEEARLYMKHRRYYI
jgi:ribonucleoside-diphosphate reductase alpha chain